MSIYCLYYWESMDSLIWQHSNGRTQIYWPQNCHHNSSSTDMSCEILSASLSDIIQSTKVPQNYWNLEKTWKRTCLTLSLLLYLLNSRPGGDKLHVPCIYMGKVLGCLNIEFSTHHKISNISCTKSQNLNDSHRVMLLSAQSIETRWLVENEDVVGATPTG